MNSAQGREPCIILSTAEGVLSGFRKATEGARRERGDNEQGSNWVRPRQGELKINFDRAVFQEGNAIDGELLAVRESIVLATCLEDGRGLSKGDAATIIQSLLSEDEDYSAVGVTTEEVHEGGSHVGQICKADGRNANLE
ncbi:hypothetical protein ACH5RR_035073 [Cinchona calisaya]|uniref:Uncharacterized protein n=1 Tax=Cinchona calisaya TaxID=153742 RepID=A0ABD2YH78_9GENT